MCPGPAGSASTSRCHPAPPSATSSSRSRRPTPAAHSACRRGPRDEAPAGLDGLLHRRGDGADAVFGGLRPRRGLLLHRRAELRAVAAAPAARASGRAGADRALLVLQLRAPGPDQAALRAVTPALRKPPRRRARVAAAGVRLRGAALVLALRAGPFALDRRRSLPAAPLLVRRADVLSRPPRVLRRAHLRALGRSGSRVAARAAALVRVHVRRRARGEAQRVGAAAGVARARAVVARAAAAAALDSALAAGALRLLAAALARPAAAPRRLDRVPHPPRPLRVVVLRPRPSRAAVSGAVSAGGGRARAAAAAGRAARGG